MGFTHNRIITGAPATSDVEMIDTEAKPETTQQYDFYEPIDKAYEWNSQRLLDMVLGECEL